MAELDLAAEAKRIAEFLNLLTSRSGLKLRYRIVAGAGAADPHGLERRDLYVDLSGPDAGILVERQGEVLRALEHVAAKILKLEPQDHDRISFDALGFKAERAEELKDLAEEAVDRVRSSGRPYEFYSMNSRERRMLHLLLKEHEDLRTESSGEGARRFVVLYPKDMRSHNNRRAAAIGKAFRRR